MSTGARPQAGARLSVVYDLTQRLNWSAMPQPTVTPMFGRERDLNYLLQRVSKPGLTTLAARPQQGKTRLLEAVRDTLRRSESPKYLVGYYEGRREVHDLLLRAIADLYENWLSNSTWLEQAKAVVHQQRGSWLNMLGAAGGRLASLITAFDPTGITRDAIQTFFSGLVEVNKKLVDGGLTLPRLSYEQMRDLLKLVHELTKAPAVVILDAFEQVPDCGRQASNLHQYLSRSDEWPPVHFLLTSRSAAESEDEDETYAEAKLFAGESSSAAVYDLGQMDLRDPAEQDRLLKYLEAEVKATAQMNGFEVMDLIDGHAGVIGRWLREKPQSVDELDRLTKDAREFQYRELGPAFEKLYREKKWPLFEVAARMALLPEAKYGAGTSEFEEMALGAEAPETMDELVDCGVLERDRDGQHCSFGLTARYERARKMFISHPTWNVRRRAVAERLLIDLASSVRDEGELSTLFAAIQLGVDGGSACFDAAARSFCTLIKLGLFTPEWGADELKAVAQAMAFVRQYPKLARVAAMMLSGCVNSCSEASDFSRCDYLLKELRDLTRSHPDEPIVRERLARGLYDAQVFAMQEDELPRRDDLLNELRELAQAHPKDVAIAEQLAKGLYNALYGAKEDELPRRDQLLDELRELGRAHVAESGVRAALARGLGNTIGAMTKEQDPARQNQLVQELRLLAQSYPNDANLRDDLVKVLMKAGVDRIQEGNRQPGFDLLQEADLLIRAHPDEPGMQENAEIMALLKRDITKSLEGEG
ncbi:MAG: hypothetical protein AABO57_23760 [Acidobacteriota bacterium]